MALAIKISSFISGGYTGDLMRWILKEDVSGAVIDTHEEPGPHGVIYNFSFSYNIRDIIYRIELYDVPPGGSVGNLIKSHVVSVTTQTLVIDPDIEIIVGRGTAVDPAAGDTRTPDIPALVGKTWRVVQRSIGPLLQTREPEVVNNNVDGYFSLTDGATFNDSDVFFVEVFPGVVINPPGTSGGGIYKSIELIDAERPIVAADMGKKLIIDGHAKVMTFDFPSKLDLPEKTPLFIENLATDDININIVMKAMDGGDVFKFNGTSNQKFILSRGDSCEIVRLGNDLYAFSNSYNIKYRGEIEYLLKLGIARIAADGTEYEQADFPGLMQYVDSLNPVQVKTTFAEWNLTSVVDGITYYYNHGFYAKYGTKIRVPNLLDMSQKALLNIGGADASRYENIAGGMQKQQVGQVNTTMVIPKGNSYTGGPNQLRIGNGNNAPQNFDLSVVFNVGKLNTVNNIGYIPSIII